MDSKEFPNILLRCILCCRIDDPNVGFIDIGKKQMPSSKKTVKSVLIHLSKCLKKDYDFDSYSCVCMPCFERIAMYDEMMVRLLTHQKELGQMLEESMKNAKENDEKSVQVKNEDDYKFELVMEGPNQETEYIKKEVESESNSNSDDGEKASGNELEEDDEEFTKRSFACTICENKFKSKRALQIHLKTHLKFVSCSICGVAKKDEEYLELHMNTHEGKTEKECRYCPKKYSRRSHVIRHMHLHWDKKKFQCEKCGVRFSQAYILYNHKMNHEAEEEPIICDICQQSFKSKRTFKHHMITHQEDRPMYPCEICGKVFSQKYTIKAHLKTHTNGSESNRNTNKKNNSSKKHGTQISCIICDKVMGAKESLEIHMAEQHDVINELEKNVSI